MKLLYGVQATGNGHITRARSLAPCLRSNGIELDCLFSGREKDKLFDMDVFGHWRCCKGLTFYHHSGSLSIPQTIRKNSAKQFLHDVKSLDLSKYDAVITDFEPIVAHAARAQNITTIGIGHQYAFSKKTHGKVPRSGNNWLTDTIIRYFAPADIELGLHWHHFNQAILPPIADPHTGSVAVDTKKIVVYLGFEDPIEVIAMLEPLNDYRFVYYAPFSRHDQQGHIELKPLSRDGFQQDLATCGGVICNAGFELASEAIQLGKKLLQKPLKGQTEQLSNAKALELLGLGTAMNSLDRNIVRDWLDNANARTVRYPNVAAAIAKWISEGDWHNTSHLNNMIIELWKNTDAKGLESFERAPLPEL